MGSSSDKVFSFAQVGGINRLPDLANLPSEEAQFFLETCDNFDIKGGYLTERERIRRVGSVYANFEWEYITKFSYDGVEYAIALGKDTPTGDWEARVFKPGGASPVESDSLILFAYATYTDFQVVVGFDKVYFYGIQPGVNTTVKYIDMDTDGFDATSVATGTITNANLTAESGPHEGVYFKERAFLVRGNRLWFSEIGDPLTFGSTNYIVLNDAQSVRISAYRDFLIIAGQDRLYTMYVDGSPADWILETSLHQTGITDFLNYNGQLFITTADGFYSTDLYTSQLLSDVLNSDVREYNFGSVFTYKDKFIIPVKSDSTQAIYAVYHPMEQAWTEYTWQAALGTFPVGTNLGIEISDHSGHTNAVFITPNSATSKQAVYTFETPTASSHGDEVTNTSVDMLLKLKTREIFLGSPIFWKRGKWLLLRTKRLNVTPQVNLSIFIDGEEVTTETAYSHTGANTKFHTWKLPIQKYLRSASFELDFWNTLSNGVEEFDNVDLRPFLLSADLIYSIKGREIGVNS